MEEVWRRRCQRGSELGPGACVGVHPLLTCARVARTDRPLDPPVHIETEDALRKVAARLSQESVVAVDTESNSLFAHRERVCLVQISTSKRDFLIDPLAPLDLAPLAQVFADAAIVKVFHDAENDVQALKRVYPFEFAGLFDTKVAAMSLGKTAVGLAAVLDAYFSVRLDKKYQRSDWGQRPLSQAQLEYARLDTHYLPELAKILRAELLAAGEPHLQEVASECLRLAALVPPARRFDPEEFTRLRGADRLDPDARRRLRELFIARERLAQARDLPPFKVIGPDTLVTIARSMPTDEAALAAIPGLTPRVVDRCGAEILNALRRAARLRPIPMGPARDADSPGLTVAQRGAYDRLRAWRKQTAAARGVDASLILPRPVMQQLAELRSPPRDLEALTTTGLIETWRGSRYGAGILAALRGGAAEPREREARPAPPSP